MATSTEKQSLHYTLNELILHDTEMYVLQHFIQLKS